MLVPADKLDEAAAIAQATVEQMPVGNPMESTTAMGPVVSKAQWDRVQQLIQTGIDEGATLICGGTGKPVYTRP